MKISFVSRGTLLISLFSIIGMIALKIFPNSSQFLILDGICHLTSWKWYLSNFTYIFGQVDTLHLVGNLSIILLLGPLIELKYGTKRMLIMTLSILAMTNQMLRKTMQTFVKKFLGQSVYTVSKAAMLHTKPVQI
jgi:GlpG protein